jgi:hypothetical protein
MGVTELIFKLNNLKTQNIGHIEDHCCHSNGSCDSFFRKKANSVVIILQ